MNPSIRHEVVGRMGLPHRLRIAHLSDLHLWFSERKLRVIEDALASLDADVLALTGDYADTSIGRRLAVEWLRKMAVFYPVCWVAGNHDRWCGRSFLRRLEALVGVHPIDRCDAWIADHAGRGYRFTSWERARDVATVPREAAPTVVLLHNPADIPLHDRLGGHHVLLAGHLHGGQITLWRDGRGRAQPAATYYRWLVDRAAVGDATLIVSRGLGDSFPVRIGVPREIVLVDFWA